jgi:hypothetical protein
VGGSLFGHGASVEVWHRVDVVGEHGFSSKCGRGVVLVGLA